jgi:hypothetical protein
VLKNEISTFIIAGLIVLLYPKLKHIFLKKTDRFFYRFPYNRYAVLNLINRQCGLKVDYDEYFYCLSDIIEKKLKIGKSMLVLQKKNKILHIYNHNFSRKFTKLLKQLDIIPNDFINHYNQHHQKVLAFQMQPELKKIIATNNFYRETVDKFIKFGLIYFYPFMIKMSWWLLFFWVRKCRAKPIILRICNYSMN